MSPAFLQATFNASETSVAALDFYAPHNPADIIKSGMRLAIRSSEGSYYVCINCNGISSAEETGLPLSPERNLSSISTHNSVSTLFTSLPDNQDSQSRQKYKFSSINNRGLRGAETLSTFSCGYGCQGSSGNIKNHDTAAFKNAGITEHHPLRVGAAAEFTILNVTNPFCSSPLYHGQEIIIIHGSASEKLVFDQSAFPSSLTTTSTIPTLSSTPRSWSRLSTHHDETRKDKNYRGAMGSSASFHSAPMKNRIYQLLSSSEDAKNGFSVVFSKVNYKDLSALESNVRWIIQKKNESAMFPVENSENEFSHQGVPITSCDIILLKNVRTSSFLALQMYPKKDVKLVAAEHLKLDEDSAVSYFFGAATDKSIPFWRLVRADFPVPSVGNLSYPALLQSIHTVDHVFKYLSTNHKKLTGKKALIFDELAKAIGNDSMVLKNIEAYWPHLPRRIREQILLEDILYCFMGVEGSLIKVEEYYVAPTSQISEPMNVCNALNEQIVAQNGAIASLFSVSSFPVGVNPMLNSLTDFEHTIRNCLPEFKVKINLNIEADVDDTASDSVKSMLSDNNGICKTNAHIRNDDKSLCEIIKDIMRLCTYHRTVCRFVEFHSNEANGTVSHALCAVIRKLLKEFLFRVTQLETYLRAGALTLQKLRVFLQPIFSTFELLNKLSRKVYGKHGGQILNAIAETLKEFPYGNNGRQLCEILMQEASTPLCKMLELWTYRGQIDDSYNEFFIQEDVYMSHCGSGISVGHGAVRCFPAKTAYENLSSMDVLNTEMRSLNFNCALYDNSSALCHRGGVDVEEDVESKGGGLFSPRSNKKKKTFLFHSSSTASSSFSSFDNSYWSTKFRLVEEMLPKFLLSVKDKILHTGKYLNVLASCTEKSQFFKEIVEVPIRYSANERAYLEVLENAYLCASRLLVRYFIKDLDLKGRLQTMRIFFFLSRSDFLLCFLDHADVELEKQQTSIGQLESLFDLCVRTSSTANDPYKDDITVILHDISNIAEAASSIDKECMFLSSDTAALLQGFGAANFIEGATYNSSSNRLLGTHLDNNILSTSARKAVPSNSTNAAANATIAAAGSAMPSSQTILAGEAYKRLVLQYIPKWPLNLLFTPGAIYKYQLVFRLLNQFKFVERKLHCVWQDHMFTKELFALSNAGEQLLAVLRTREEMLHFCRNFVYYATVEVVEPYFIILMNALDSATTFDEMLSLHESFLKNVLTECLLTDSKLLGALCKVLSICTIFARHVLKFSLDYETHDLPSTVHSAHDNDTGRDESFSFSYNAEADAEKSNAAEAPKRGRGSGRHPVAARFGGQRIMSVLNKRKNRLENMRAHLECILNDKGFSGMVNSATKQFHEKLYQFLELLVLYSRTKVDHHAVHLLTRLNFNNFYADSINVEGI